MDPAAEAHSRGFYGQVVDSRSGRGLILTETRYPPHFKIPEHSHQHAYLGFLLQGAYTELGEPGVVCEPPTMVFHPSERAHSEVFHGTGGRLFNIEVETRWLQKADAQRLVPDRALARRAGLTRIFAIKLYREFDEFDDVSLVSIEGLLLELMAETYRYARSSGTSSSRWLRQVTDLLHDRFSEALTLHDIADAVGLNPAYIAQTFRRHYRCTVGEYIRRLRVEFASHQISTSDAPLSQIALSAGFSDQAHFCRTFKKLTAMTPSQYRALVHGSQSETKTSVLFKT